MAIEDLIREQAEKNFEKGETWNSKKISDITKQSLKKRYGDFVVERYNAYLKKHMGMDSFNHIFKMNIGYE